jgi:hypothetical protein
MDLQEGDLSRFQQDSLVYENIVRARIQQDSLVYMNIVRVTNIDVRSHVTVNVHNNIAELHWTLIDFIWFSLGDHVNLS